MILDPIREQNMSGGLFRVQENNLSKQWTGLTHQLKPLRTSFYDMCSREKAHNQTAERVSSLELPQRNDTHKKLSD